MIKIAAIFQNPSIEAHSLGVENTERVVSGSTGFIFLLVWKAARAVPEEM